MSESIFQYCLHRKSGKLFVEGCVDVDNIVIEAGPNIEIALIQVSVMKIQILSYEYPHLLSLPFLYCIVSDKNSASITVFPTPDKDYRVIKLH